ncbi:restriction endonuclease subunit S [Pseudoalteromonas sp. NZS71_1]|uniref:restriction endonuclease subunit S n=1 Tax=Pseudoalteromonas sp. NZS71_1 TaxID=2792072 RepID=UPI0018CDF577|nr:restriction endonuclease subunit S [Pseudoalteromonas sp. NZS71_1]MBH0035442.1 restriction endonuclease subunit S [Pseudoalteromonas sp. NZS71_1]
MELLTKKLGDICHLITDGKHGNCKDQLDSGYYFVSCKDVKGGQVNYSGARQISAEDFKETDRRTQFAAGDILITNSGTIGRMCLAKDLPETRRTTFQKSVAIIKADNDLVTSEYLYYYLLSEKDRLCNLAGGAAQKNLLLSDMRCFDVEIPKDKLLQKNWASKVRSYDLLIENNNRRIAILEDMAQSLYREWFVNFRYPNHEDNLDADGKPKLIDSPLGQIPEGWEFDKLENMSSMKYGKMSKKDLRCKEGIPIYSGYKITGYYPEANLNESKVIVIARGVGGTGDVKMSPDICWLTNLSIYIMENEDLLKKSYLFYQLKFANLRSLDSGTSISQITIADLSKYQIIAPPIELQVRFEELCKSFWSQVKVLTKKNENLKKQRDMLLPKLISGQIELKD